MYDATTRDTLHLTFMTSEDRLRSLSLADCLPLEALSFMVLLPAADDIIDANVFDDSLGRGRLSFLHGAVHQRDVTRVLFKD